MSYYPSFISFTNLAQSLRMRLAPKRRNGALFLQRQPSGSAQTLRRTYTLSSVFTRKRNASVCVKSWRSPLPPSNEAPLNRVVG